MPGRLRVTDLSGLTDYETAHRRQQAAVADRVAGDSPDTLLLLEHPPVITIGHSGRESDILASKATLDAAGISVHRIERGGQVTYHGPGQIVGYAVVDLHALKIGVAAFIDRLEAVLIDTAAALGVQASRKPGAPGVYVDGKKIGAVGVRVTRGVTFHGFSFNAAPDLSHYQWIRPCGMTPGDVTSIETVLGRRPDIPAVKRLLADAFLQVFGMIPA